MQTTMPSFSSVFVVIIIFVRLSSANSLPPSDQQQLQIIRSNDTAALLLFRSQVDSHGALARNWTTRNACARPPWRGVRCAGGGRVTRLVLPSLGLRGPLDALSALDQLRLLNLRRNRLTGTISPLSGCTNLKLLYISGNDLSGTIPENISSLRHLTRLDLSDNNLSGPIPDALSKMTRLVTLYLQDNALWGNLPDLSSSLPGLRELNVSNNELSGTVPEGIRRKFGDESFSGNSKLCGLLSSPPQQSVPFLPCSFAGSLPFEPSAQPTVAVVPSNPSWKPGTAMMVGPSLGKKKGRLSNVGIFGIVAADGVVLLVIASFMAAYYCKGKCRNRDAEADDGGAKKGSSCSASCSSSEKKHGGEVAAGGDDDRNRLVFFDRGRNFEVEDLLKASAEMLGKGSLGTVYRAVLDCGRTVAVKRLRDANPCTRKEFEQYMDIIGKLRHPNIVRLRGYYYAKEEKLLVYDYLPNGSLHSLLHENRGPGRTPLDWTTRVGLVLGAARGLARIHQEHGSAKIPHGNVKSSNVLLDKNGAACVADFGLALLLSPANAVARMGGYRAPEQRTESKRLSQKADVYAFGVLLMEVLTGRVPSPHLAHVRQQPEEDLPEWVRSTIRKEWTAEIFDPELLRYKNVEEEMVAMLHVALACAAPQPEERPAMAAVVKLIEDVRVEQSPIGEELEGSRSSLSPSIATTEDARISY